MRNIIIIFVLVVALLPVAFRVSVAEDDVEKSPEERYSELIAEFVEDAAKIGKKSLSSRSFDLRLTRMIKADLDYFGATGKDFDKLAEAEKEGYADSWTPLPVSKKYWRVTSGRITFSRSEGKMEIYGENKGCVQGVFYKNVDRSRGFEVTWRLDEIAPKTKPDQINGIALEIGLVERVKSVDVHVDFLPNAHFVRLVRWTPERGRSILRDKKFEGAIKPGEWHTTRILFEESQVALVYFDGKLAFESDALAGDDLAGPPAISALFCNAVFKDFRYMPVPKSTYKKAYLKVVNSFANDASEVAEKAIKADDKGLACTIARDLAYIGACENKPISFIRELDCGDGRNWKRMRCHPVTTVPSEGKWAYKRDGLIGHAGGTQSVSFDIIGEQPKTGGYRFGWRIGRRMDKKNRTTPTC